MPRGVIANQGYVPGPKRLILDPWPNAEVGGVFPGIVGIQRTPETIADWSQPSVPSRLFFRPSLAPTIPTVLRSRWDDAPQVALGSRLFEHGNRAIDLSTFGLAHTRAMGADIVNATLLPASITRTRALGSPLVNPKLFPSGLDHSKTLGSPTVTIGSAALAPVGLSHGKTLGSPTVNVKLFPSGLDHSKMLGSPIVNVKLFPSGIAHTRGIGTPNVIRLVSPASLSHTRSLGTTALAVKIFVSGLDHGRTLGQIIVPGPPGSVTDKGTRFPSHITT